MRCPRCGEEAPEAARFCPSCRSDLDAVRGGPPKDSAPAEPTGPGEAYDVVAAGRDLLDLLIKGASFVMLTVAIVAGLSLFYVASIGTLHVGLVVGSTALTMLLGWAALRAKKELLPSLAPAHETIEFDDVQMQVFEPEPCPRGRLFFVTVRVQNCVNRPREVRLEFECEPRPKEEEQRHLLFHSQVKGSLGPGETAELQLPLVLGPSAPAHLLLWVTPSASGQEARRVRHAKGQPFVERVTTTDTLLYLTVGGIVVGGGLAIRPRWLMAPAEDDWRALLPAPAWRVLHVPDDDVLRRASA